MLSFKIYIMETKNLFSGKFQHFLVRLLFTLFFIILCFYKVAGQTSDNSGSVFKGGSYGKTFSTTRVGVAQSVMTTPKGEFHLVIQHRFGEISQGFYEFFGLDAALTRIGLDYGISDWLSTGIGRSLFEKSFDLELKASILKQEESSMPVSLSYYTAAIENTVHDYYPEGHTSFGSRLSFVNQIIIARNQGILSFQASPMWLHSVYEVRTSAPLDVFAVDLDARIRLSEKFGVITEYIPILTNETFTGTNPFTIGLDINTGGHQFQLIFSNSQGTNEKQILTNTEGSWSGGHFYFGFNLTRVFHSKSE
jgi:hypothetical protein